MRLPNLNALRMFDAAARHLNFRRAADELNLTQGAVAQQVRQLEADLAVRLFRRHARGLTLTPPGEDFAGEVGRALALIESATLKIQARKSDLVVSVTPSFAAKWLVPRLHRFAERFPEINLQTIASERRADFRRDGVDVAIRQGRPPFDSDLEVRLLTRLNLCAVCSQDYPDARMPVRRFCDFADQMLIEDSHAHWRSLFAAAGPVPAYRSMRFNQIALAIDAAANGQGVALAPHILVDADLAAGRLRTLWRDDRPDQDGYYILYPKTAAADPVRDAMVDWILSELED
ncbi:MAG: LysR substrate-binding domain-containing protein [Pseudomonadota bacterium]